MLRRFNCCYKKYSSNSYQFQQTKNIEECLRIPDDTINRSINLVEKPSIIEVEDWLKIPISINWEDTIPFVPPIDKGIVIKVYDGDTITIASKLPYSGSPLYRFSVRLNGIDCPEIKGISEDEKKCAQLAKQEMSNLVLNKIVRLKNVDTEKYGRILADVYIDDLHVNKHMLDKRLAVEYDGGTKLTPANWMEYYNNNIR